MKRDWDLIRVILQRAEDAEVGKQFSATDEFFNGYQIDFVQEHINMLCDKGFIKGTYGLDPRRAIVLGLTFDGHDFLDNIKSDTVWNKTKAVIKEKGIEMTVDAVKYSAKSVIKSMFNID